MSADGEPFHAPWPDWNGSWRDVEWIGLGPGWLPSSLDPSSREEDLYSTVRRVPAIPLTASIHAPPAGSPPSSSDPDLPWDVEVERIKYRQAKEMEAYENILSKGREVERHIHRIRRENGGKWVHFSFGGDGEEEKGILETILERVDKLDPPGR
jgi:hypothetical protein